MAWTARAKWRDLPGEIAGGFVGALPLLLANHATTGSAFRFGYDVLWGTGHRVGFHSDPYGNTHTLGHGLDLATTYVGRAEHVPARVAGPGDSRRRGHAASRRDDSSRWDGLILALLGAQLAAYGTYWGEGEFLGPRFLYTALPALVVLIARAPFVLAERFDRRVLARRGRERAGVSGDRVARSRLAVRRAGSRDPSARRAPDAQGRHRRRGEGRERAPRAVFLREPFTMRLARRLWGVGMTRSDAAQLIARQRRLFDSQRRSAPSKGTRSSVDDRLASERASGRPLLRGRRDAAGFDRREPGARLASRSVDHAGVSSRAGRRPDAWGARHLVRRCRSRRSGPTVESGRRRGLRGRPRRPQRSSFAPGSAIVAGIAWRSVRLGAGDFAQRCHHIRTAAKGARPRACEPFARLDRTRTRPSWNTELPVTHSIRRGAHALDGRPRCLSRSPARRRCSRRCR